MSKDRGEKLKPLRFGTSGLRALVSEMTDLECYINTKGFLMFLEETGEAEGGGSIALGGDLRSSTARIMAAVKRAVEDQGSTVDFCGRVPSPVLTFYAMEKCRSSIMVTGSHIPDDRNGIKFTKASGEVLKSDEALILKNVGIARKEEYAKAPFDSLFDEEGMFKEEEGLADAADAACFLYERRYLELFDDEPLRGLKLVFYQHSAVGRDLLPEIFKGLGAEVIPVARSEKFVPVDTEKVSLQTSDFLKEMAKEHRPFAVLSTDGDSDRPLLADENGQFLPGDKLGALAAIYLKPSFVAVPISTNDAVVRALKNENIQVVQTKIGSPYVIQAMIDKSGEDSESKLASWEANGGFLLGSDWKIDDRILKALPTRDALLPMLSALLLARKEGISLSQLIALKLPERYTAAGVIDNNTPGCESYTAEMGKKIIEMFLPQNTHILQIEFIDNGHCLVSSREKKEGAIPELLTELTRIKDRLASFFSGANGFSEVTSINYIDGIRIGFMDGDIAHLRPSGNAPEFRIYAEADTEMRAVEIVEKGNRIMPQIISSQ